MNGLKRELINALPPFKNDWQVIVKKQGTDDIIDEVLEAHKLFQGDYDLIYKFFDTGNIETIARKLWDFQRNELTYEAETGKDQSSRNPSAILQLPDDCKHYALFTSGVLSAIQRHKKDMSWDWFYRFASDTTSRYVTHVFVVVETDDTEYWIDPCLSAFDRRKNYLITEDYNEMLYRITGINDVAADLPKTVDVDPKEAFEAFLTMLAGNCFPILPGGVSLIKKLFVDNPQITNGPVRQWFLQNGFDWNQVLRFIHA